MDERLLAGGLAPDEREPDATLRPQRLGEFVGQTKLKETLGVFLTIAAVYVLGHPEFGWAEATARAALIIGAFNLLPVSPGSLVRGIYVIGLCVKEKNIRDYRLALPVSFFKIIGYLDQ